MLGNCSSDLCKTNISLKNRDEEIQAFRFSLLNYSFTYLVNEIFSLLTLQLQMTTDGLRNIIAMKRGLSNFSSFRKVY